MSHSDLPHELPAAWPDGLRLWRPKHIWILLCKLLGYRLRAVELPAGLKLRVALPPYLLQEFHNLPNGNYSKSVAAGYCTGFDWAMLGTMRNGREAIASALAGCKRVLDVGCGTGGATAALFAAGVDQVIGLDASPYLLKQAAELHPTLEFVQGLAEKTEFGADTFDGISCCFLFHELPQDRADDALREFKRLLSENGRIVILEPAREQYVERPLSLLRRFGWRGLYFSWLAHFVNEPFVHDWHQRDVGPWLSRFGFEIMEERLLFPSKLLVVRRSHSS